MSFSDYDQLNVKKYLDKYGNISVLELLKILEEEKNKEKRNE